MVSLGDRVKKGMTAIRFYFLEDIDIFYDEAASRLFPLRVQPGFPKYVTSHLTTVNLIYFQEQPATV